MPGKTDNKDYAKQVSQGGPYHDGSEAFDASHGTYKEQRPAVEPGTAHKQIPAPFKLGG